MKRTIEKRLNRIVESALNEAFSPDSEGIEITESLKSLIQQISDIMERLSNGNDDSDNSNDSMNYMALSDVRQKLSNILIKKYFN